MLKEELEIPQGLEARFAKDSLFIKGRKGELSKELKHPLVSVKVEGGKIIIASENERKKVKAIIGTWAVITRNMFTGVTQGWKGEMKLVYSHFPIKLKLDGSTLFIENFLGERSARKVSLPSNVKVDIDKSVIYVSGLDKELVGQACSRIEQATRIKDLDKRVFQDGLYITSKPLPEGEHEK